MQRRIDKFYKHIDRANDEKNAPAFRAQQLKVAERSYKQLQRKKSLNVGLLRSAIERTREKISRAQGAANQDRASASLFAQKIGRLIRPSFSLNWTSVKDNGPIRKSIATYRGLADELASARYARVRASSPTLTSYCTIMSQASKRVAVDKRKYKGQLSRAHHADPVHNEILLWQARFYAGALLCSKPEIAVASKAIDNYVASLGGLDGARKRVAGAKQERAAKVRMSPAVVRDKKLSSLFRRVFVGQKWNEPIRAIRLTSASWDVLRHPATGKVTGRTRTAQIAVSQGAACRLYDFTIFEPKVGAGFGSARRHVHGSRVIACKNIPTR